MRIVFYFLLCLSIGIESSSQKAEYFQFSIPTKKISYSVFDTAEFIDTRLTQDHVGIKRDGDRDRLVPVWLHAPLVVELKALIDSAIKTVPQQPNTLLINVRKFFISQYTGRFEFQVECYSKWEDGYWMVYHLDSFYKSMPHELSKKVNDVVEGFIYSIVRLDLSKTRRGKAVSYDYISNIDMNEKKALPVFNVKTATRGVYYTYEEFKNNTPRVTMFNMAKRGNKLNSIFRPPVGNKLAKKIPRDSIYAVSDGEYTWLAAPHEYALLNKRGLDFFFSATAYENNKIEEVSLGFLFFGLPGVLVTAIPRRAMYEFRLDHINGKYILLRRAADR